MPETTATISLINPTAGAYCDIRPFLNALPRNPQAEPLRIALERLQQALDQVQQVLRTTQPKFTQLNVASSDIFDSKGKPLLGDRAPAIPVPAGGATVDAEARTAIAALIAALSASTSGNDHQSLIG